VVALGGIGAARAPAQNDALCIPLLMTCPAPTQAPSPTPSPSPTKSTPPGGIVGGLLGAVPGTTTAPGAQPAVPLAIADPNAPTFTLPAAQLGGTSISITGLHSVSVVTVPLADGSRTPVIKLVADDIAIPGFTLDVRKATGPKLVTTTSRMELRGNVQVYLDSVTGSLSDGTGVSFGAATPPPGNEFPSTLLRVTLGLVGVTADSIVLTTSHEALK
jgi:hypothetical protein